MCRRSFIDVATRRGNLKTNVFQAVKQGLMLA